MVVEGVVAMTRGSKSELAVVSPPNYPAADLSEGQWKDTIIDFNGRVLEPIDTNPGK